jgi:hypothetical protein
LAAIDEDDLPSRASAQVSTPVSNEQSRVVELALIGDNVRVRPRCRDEVVVADELPDPRPTASRPSGAGRRQTALTISGRNGNGGAQIICDGQRHTYAVAVFGGGPAGFQLGQAEASGNAFCPNSGSDFTTQSIRITKS